MPKFIAMTTGHYTYDLLDHWGREKLGTKEGHCVYGLTEEGQIMKFVCYQGKWQWAEIEKTVPEKDI